MQSEEQAIILGLAQNNPGAISVLAELYKRDGMLPIILLGANRVMGPNIWVLHKDVCGQDIQKTAEFIQNNPDTLLDLLRQQPRFCE